MKKKSSIILVAKPTKCDLVSPVTPGQHGGLSVISNSLPVSWRHVSEGCGVPGAFTPAWPREAQRVAEGGASGLLFASCHPRDCSIPSTMSGDGRLWLINSAVLGPRTGLPLNEASERHKDPCVHPTRPAQHRGTQVATVQSAMEGEPRDPCTLRLPLPTFPETPHPNTPTRTTGLEGTGERGLNVRIVGQNHSSSFCY